MRDANQPTRRQVLAACGVALGTATAGCQGDGGGTNDTTDGDGGNDTTAGGGLNSDRATTVEDFEDPLDDWNVNRGVDRDSGVQDDVAFEGTRAMDLVNVGGFDGSVTSLPGDGLDAYPSLGDAVSIWTRCDGGASPRLGFCYLWQDVGGYGQGLGSGYATRVLPADDELQIAKYDDGDAVDDERVETLGELHIGEWYRLVVDTTEDGAHSVRLIDTDETELGRAELQDAEWNSGGYGLVFSGNDTDGESSYWDALGLTEGASSG